MESRKVVLMNLFAGQQELQAQRTDLRTWEEGRKERVGGKERLPWNINITTCEIDV